MRYHQNTKNPNKITGFFFFWVKKKRKIDSFLPDFAQ